MINEKKSCDTVPLKQNISAYKNALISFQKLYKNTVYWNYPFKAEWMDFWKDLNFSIQSFHKINYLSSLPKQFYYNNSITEWRRKSTDSCRTTFSFQPNSSESEKLGLVQSIIYLCGTPYTIVHNLWKILYGNYNYSEYFPFKLTQKNISLRRSLVWLYRPFYEYILPGWEPPWTECTRGITELWHGCCNLGWEAVSSHLRMAAWI